MSEPFIFIDTYGLRDGMAAEYRAYLDELVEFVEANEPRLLHYAVYINDEETEVTGVQVHPDAASMESHMQLLGQRIGQGMTYLDPSTMRIQVCGTFTETLDAFMRQVAGSGPSLSVKKPLAGFSRIAPTT